MSIPASKTAATRDKVLDDAANNVNDLETEEEIEEIDGEETEDSKLEAAVNEAVGKITRDNKGRYVLPEGLSPELRIAVLSEKRRRDTQSSFTKEAQEKKALKAENAALKHRVSEYAKIELTAEQQTELEDLKFSDPEAWREKLNAYEKEHKEKHNKKLDEELGQVSADILANEELEQRKDTLKQFNKVHPDFKLDDDVIKNDIPPRIVKKLETGVISFEAFLQECYDYLKTGKVVKQDKLSQQPNLSKVGGGQSPDKHAAKEDIILSYSKEVF